MAVGNLNEFVRRLARAAQEQALAALPDQQLVQRAAAGGDEAAFRALVSRHGLMVYRVCGRLLRHAQDAEDAFQATFLVLARRLPELRQHSCLAGWLCGVARRVALKAREREAARERREVRAALPDALPAEDVTWAELRRALDDELGQLPDEWRLPLVLCYLEGRTQEESARELGWSKSTLRRRLAQARAALRARLQARDIALPAALSAVLLFDGLPAAAPPPGLVSRAAQTAARVAAGEVVTSATSAEVAALTKGALTSMCLTRRVMVAAALLLVGLAGVGAGSLYRPGPAARAEPPQESRPEEKASRQDAEVRRALDELEAARAELQKVNEIAEAARKRFLAARERYEAARRRGRAVAPLTLTGVLAQAEAGSIRVELWKEWHEPDHELLGSPFSGGGARVYETFPVAKGAAVTQDNVKARLAELKEGSRVTLTLDAGGKTVARVAADGGTARGVFVSANEGRHTILVRTARGEQKTFHLVKETEVTVAGKAVGLRDLARGTPLLLTLSVEDANTAVRVEDVPPGGDAGVVR